MRTSVLESMLPAPAEAVPISELAAFKERYGSELAVFGRSIEDRLVDFAMVEQDWAHDRKLQLFQDDLDQQLVELQARMEERKWPGVVLGTICGLVAAAIPGVREVVEGHTVAAGMAAPGLISTLYFAMPKLWQKKDFMRSPIAYAALAQRQLAG